MGERLLGLLFVVAALMLVTAAVVFVTGACSSPCDELASTICGCERTRDREDACRQTFVTGNPVSISSQRQDACDKYLDTCTCEALDAGDFAACGLANKPQ